MAVFKKDRKDKAANSGASGGANGGAGPQRPGPAPAADGTVARAPEVVAPEVVAPEVVALEAGPEPAPQVALDPAPEAAAGAVAEAAPEVAAGTGAAANEASPEGPAAARPPNDAELMSTVLWLLLRSPMHRHLFLADLEWLVLPALALKQFRLFRHKDRPFAYVSWARLGEEAEKLMRGGARRLRPLDWNSGERLWLVDFTVPFGGADAVIKELRETVFPDKEFSTVLVNRETGKPEVKTWRGVTLAGEREAENVGDGDRRQDGEAAAQAADAPEPAPADGPSAAEARP